MFVLLVSAALLAVTVTGQVEIEVTPENATLSEGQDFFITCTSGLSAPGLDINGETADPNNNDRLSSEAPSALIAIFNYSSVMPSDNGTTFVCTGQGEEPSDTVTLIVLYSPILVISDDEVSVCEGEGATVTLTADANPAVMTNMVVVRGNADPDVDVTGQTITISFSNVMRAADGEYSVEVTNSQGTSTETFTLNVYYGPTFNVEDNAENTEIATAVGESVRLDCSIAESKPDATVEYSTTASSSEGVVFANDIISIDSVTEGNAGMYTCIANNTVKDATLTFTLSIGELPSATGITVTAEFNEDGDLVVTFNVDSSDDTVTRYEIILTYDSNRVSLANYTSASRLEETVIDLDLDLDREVSYTVELLAFNRYGYRSVDDTTVMFAETGTDGAGATIATMALVLMMLVMSLIL